MSSTATEGTYCPGDLCGCFVCGCSTRCCVCLKDVCLSCCPYLNSKDRYARIEYQPIKQAVRSEPTVPSLLATRESLKSLNTQYHPHEKEFYPQTGGNGSEGGSQVITEEPKLAGVVSGKVHPSQSAPESPYGSIEDLGVQLGFIDYETYHSVSSESSEDRNIRICRTPDVSLGRTQQSTDDPDFGEYSLQECSESMTQGFEPFAHRRSLQVSPLATPHKPSIQFSLYLDEKHDILIVHLLRAFNLPTKRAESASNPFVEVYLLPSKTEVHESRVIQQSLNPMFDHAFKFTTVKADDVRKQLLVMRIYLNDKHHFVGGVLFPLEKAGLFGSSNKIDLTIFDEEEGLKEKGDILVSMTHHPEAGTLEILILEACNLKKQDLIGLSNPYVKVILLHQGSRVTKWKTSVKKNTLMPVFNELCLLDIATMDIADVEIAVMVMDYDRFGRNHEVGSILFGQGVADSTGRDHWNNAISNPNTSHLCWHAIGTSSSLPIGLRTPTRHRSRSRSPVSCVTHTK